MPATRRATPTEGPDHLALCGVPGTAERDRSGAPDPQSERLLGAYGDKSRSSRSAPRCKPIWESNLWSPKFGEVMDRPRASPPGAIHQHRARCRAGAARVDTAGRYPAASTADTVGAGHRGRAHSTWRERTMIRGSISKTLLAVSIVAGAALPAWAAISSATFSQ
jgi:hypothetical protein